MMYFVNTADPDYQATYNYMRNLGVIRPSMRKNPVETDPFAHKLMNIMLRQAVALGWTKNIDLERYNIKPGSNQQWNRLPKPLKQLTLDEIIELIRMQVKNYLGKPGVAPTAYCYAEDGAEHKIPMIIDWKAGKLHWKVPLLYSQTTQTEEGLKGGASEYFAKDAPIRSLVLNKEGGAIHVKTKGTEHGMVIPDCYDREGRHFIPYKVSDISRWFAVWPLPFIPASWGGEARHGRRSKENLIRLFGNGVIADVDAPDFMVEGGASVLSAEATFDVTSRTNAVYSTPTAEKVSELALSYPPESEDSYQWQDLALSRFVSNDFCGMVEACTGAGKTIFCAKAIKSVIKSEEELLGSKPAISIVVPTTALLDQWYQFLVHDEFGLKNELASGVIEGVALHGGGHGGELKQVNLFVENTAAAILSGLRSESFEEWDIPEESRELVKKYSVTEIYKFNESYPSHFLIVDEAHRTTSQMFSQIYEVARDYILLVSATFPSNKERYQILEDAISSTLGLTEEAKKGKWILPSTGKEVPPGTEGAIFYEPPRMLCMYRYPHALKKGNISPFNLHIVRFSLSAEERAIYDQITAYIKHFSKKRSSELDSSEEETLQALSDIDRGTEAWKSIEQSRELQRSLGITIRGEGTEATVSTTRKDPYSVFMMKVLGGARARLSWGSGNRLACALDLIEENLIKGKTIIVFHKSIDGAAALYKLLYDRGWGAGVAKKESDLSVPYKVVDGKTIKPSKEDLIGIYHSQQAPGINEKYLKAFKDKKIRCLLSVQALLEGLDVPHCDVGIAVAADQSDIKLVQSLGRVLRVSPDTPKKDYYFLSADATKDQIIEAKFGNTLKDTDQEWIIDPPTERRFDAPPKISMDLKKEVGLPSTPKMEDFVVRLMQNNEEQNREFLEVLEQGQTLQGIAETMISSIENDIKKGTDELKQRVQIVHPQWIKFAQPARGRPKKIGPKPR